MPVPYKGYPPKAAGEPLTALSNDSLSQNVLEEVRKEAIEAARLLSDWQGQLKAALKQVNLNEAKRILEGVTEYSWRLTGDEQIFLNKAWQYYITLQQKIDPSVVVVETYLSNYPIGLRDIRRVGPEKPIGNLPYDFYMNPIITTQTLLNQLIAEAEAKGLKVVIVPRKRGNAIWVYDPLSLQKLIDANVNGLKGKGIPLTADKFVAFLTENTVYDREAFKIVGRAFNNISFRDVSMPNDILPDELKNALGYLQQTRQDL